MNFRPLSTLSVQQLTCVQACLAVPRHNVSHSVSLAGGGEGGGRGGSVGRILLLLTQEEVANSEAIDEHAQMRGCARTGGSGGGFMHQVLCLESHASLGQLHPKRRMRPRNDTSGRHRQRNGCSPPFK